MTERVTLRAGDYVSTEGMTEEQYHAVARAFMAAGAEEGEYPGSKRNRGLDFFGWQNGFHHALELFHGMGAQGRWGDRHLTPSQVIGAVNAKRRPIRGCDVTLTITREEDNMTPCEKLGYEVGDRFVAKGASTFTDGSVIELYRDDGSQYPLFRLISGHTDHECADGNEGAFCNLARITPHTPEDTLTQTLRDAADHDEKAKHHAVEHDRLMQQARDMLPDGWMLVRGGVDWAAPAPTQDMTDPANWRKGDVVTCMKTDKDHAGDFEYGHTYTVNKPVTDFGWVSCIVSGAETNSLPADHFRFHHRPT